jgi:hypothetical protein
MGHYSEFGSALWATVADLVMRYGSQRGMRPYKKISDDFYTVGHSAGFVSALWAMEQNFVMRYP